MAGTGGGHDPPLALTRRGDVRRDVLPRFGDALLPGRSPSGRGDRTATAEERALCRPWHEEELRLLRPELVVTVGLTAAREVIGVRSLTEAVGKSYLAHGAITIPLPHPSGASGWLDDTTNRRRLGKALTHVRRELDRLREGDRGRS